MISFIKRVVRFYIDGFKNMTVGKTLWVIILIKLFIMFVVLKIFFFPERSSSNSLDSYTEIVVRYNLCSDTNLSHPDSGKNTRYDVTRSVEII